MGGPRPATMKALWRRGDNLLGLAVFFHLWVSGIKQLTWLGTRCLYPLNQFVSFLSLLMTLLCDILKGHMLPDSIHS